MATGLLPWAVFRRDGNQNCLWVRKYALRHLAPLHRSELGAGVESAVTAFTTIRIETEGLSSLVSLVPSSPNELRARHRLTIAP